ncbi:MAG: hypothetical protein R3B89_17650 [Polyangiaceae bacterium]
MPQPPRLVPWRVAIPLTTTAAVAGAGIGFLVVSLVVNPMRGGPGSESSGSPAAASAPPPAAPEASEPAPSAAPEIADAAGSASPDSGSPDASPPDDLTSDAGLKPYESYLYVRSSAKADVWVHGIKIGPTNEKLKLPCTKGLRFTRLGKDPGPAWISKAVSIKIPCGSVTQLELEPEADPKLRAAPQESDNPY